MEYDGSLDWHQTEIGWHHGVCQLVCDLNRVYRETPALHQIDFEPAGFRWISADDSAVPVLSFVRYDREGGFVIAVCNMTPVPRHGYRIGVPQAGNYREALNTDSQWYGGSSNNGNRELTSEAHGSHGFAYSLRLTVPPLAVVYLQLA